MRRRTFYLVLLPAVAVASAIGARFLHAYPGDVLISQWVQSWQRPGVTAFMEAVSEVGRSALLFGLAITVTVLLFARRRNREGLVGAGAVVLLALVPLLQRLVDRPRPSAGLVGLDQPLSGLGFPSGHAYQAIVLFGALIYLATTLIGRTWLRRLTQVSLTFLILAIGISRVYLGAHWPSDVVGGYLIGGALLALMIRGVTQIFSRAAGDHQGVRRSGRGASSQNG